jgi:hypothetical protein
LDAYPSSKIIINKARPVLRFFSKAAIDDDYKQVEIAKYLSISFSAVSKIVLREREKWKFMIRPLCLLNSMIDPKVLLLA